MPTYFTPLTDGTAGNAAAWNSRLTQLDDQLVLMAAGSGFNNKSANLIFAGPSSGGAAAPSFRALVDNDIPAALTLVGSTINNSVIGGSTPAIAAFSYVNITQPAGAQLALSSPAATQKRIAFNTNLLQRWLLYSDEVAEAGSNVGSDFRILRYNDAGVFQNTSLLIVRATGDVTLEAALNVGGTFDHNGTLFGVHGAAPVARGALAEPSGTITRTTFDTATVTLPQLAQRVYAMIHDDRLRGFYS